MVNKLYLYDNVLTLINFLFNDLRVHYSIQIETATFDPHCWIDCMKLGPNGTDPDDCKLRADEGLGAIGELSPGNIFSPATSIFNPLIKWLAEELGYDGKEHRYLCVLYIYMNNMH